MGNVVGAVAEPFSSSAVKSRLSRPRDGASLARREAAPASPRGRFHVRRAKAVQSVSLMSAPKGSTVQVASAGLGVQVSREYQVPPSGPEIQGDQQVGPQTRGG